MGNVKTFLMPLAVVIAGGLIAGAVVWTAGEDGSDKQAAVGEAGSGAGRVVSLTELEETVTLHSWEQTEGTRAGLPEAPVVMVEYSDYTCPFCARHWRETLPQLKEQYIDTGLVQMVYKDFPVVGGDRAAEATHCAGDQEAFWQYHDLLYFRHEQDRRQWNRVDIHLDYADFLGLDADELRECFENRTHQAIVLESLKEASAAGGSGTPFFVIGEETISGAQSFAVFAEVIEAQLADSE